MLKLCANGSNIDYSYETSSVLRKAKETEIYFGFDLLVRVLKTETQPKFCFRTSLMVSTYWLLYRHLPADSIATNTINDTYTSLN